MARRFGRNQRRHMREEIIRRDEAIAAKNEQLSEALNRSAERGREAAELRQRLEDWATEILHLMGRDHAFNEQLARYRSEGLMDRLRLQPVMRPNIAPRGSTPPQWEKVSSVIEACIMRCRISGDHLSGMIAVEIGDHMGALVGYGLPTERRKSWTPRDIRKVAELIANKMAQHLRVEQDKAA